ncbi:Galactose-1-phosphate uridylyltransferase [Archaeoglobus sulfaticallidus PM70-1]|uniref:Galactose-1-phosphate uridylyltransferase n=1 Tax=Archaeoglobus sulfaticallidus PM70-1 TaxID=387631 RepID=N0BCA5_9EURY|nr:galactose-1-phosphate uridylyltransferase [Archaeoglobus sulfaticallidus]AGK60618.1 Galactose-1-phosphate uridylyltransferase [Archaeoglobus sulfaticallidus PM70-1]
MEFRKEVEVAKVLLNDKVEETVVEIRYDPLTLQTSRVIKKTPPFVVTHGFEEEVESTKSWCPFCPERIESMVARDPELLNGELLKRNEAVLFSNIVPYSRYSFVIRLTEAHYLDISEFKKEHFEDAFYLIKEVLSKLGDGKYYISIGMNYLKPAGSSIMHPHIQTLVSETSTDYFARMDWSALEFYEENNTDYWLALLQKEKELGERFAGETKKTGWISAFSPKGFYHFIGIPEEREFFEMSGEQISGICDGIIRILKFYKSKGLNSFNISMFLADRLGEHFRTNINIVARTPFDKYYWCDVYFPKMFHDESISYLIPEEYAKELSEFM